MSAQTKQIDWQHELKEARLWMRVPWLMLALGITTAVLFGASMNQVDDQTSSLFLGVSVFFLAGGFPLLLFFIYKRNKLINRFHATRLAEARARHTNRPPQPAHAPTQALTTHLGSSTQQIYLDTHRAHPELIPVPEKLLLPDLTDEQWRRLTGMTIRYRGGVLSKAQIIKLNKEKVVLKGIQRTFDLLRALLLDGGVIDENNRLTVDGRRLFLTSKPPDLRELSRELAIKNKWWEAEPWWQDRTAPPAYIS